MNPLRLARIIAGVEPFTLGTTGDIPDSRLATIWHSKSEASLHPSHGVVVACWVPAGEGVIILILIDADIGNQSRTIVLADGVVLVPPPVESASEGDTRAGLDILVDPHGLVEVEVSGLEAVG